MKQSSEELEIVKKYIEMPLLMDIIEVDKRKIEGGELRLKRELLAYLDSIQERITRDGYELKKKLKEMDIKIIKQERLAEKLHALYSVRGFEHEMNLLWSKVRTDSLLTLAAYMKVDITDS
ncbi:hypothetical protein [Paenibacillus illinoisensis]|uniref:Uncharacterized protein n=1 Tax=Paenibacillus illinoisensis TaxID=59845 RepID=A0A2W0C6Z0_9BACL|nr:hypothetical protein [Paenibacillus illinoisensis]PYY28230.1 Uncharacterized protein PIL02S_03376 [Paenibacillus illinoisensis]